MLPHYLEPLLNLTIPVADQTCGTANDDTLGNRVAAKQLMT